jgi:hypothetical protein
MTALAVFGGLAALGLLVWGFLRVPPALQVKLLKRALYVLIGIGVIALVLRGRIDLAFLFGALLPLINRFRSVPGFGHVGTGSTGTGTAGSAGGASEVATAWLRMRLDHGSGAADGEILQGSRRGRRLSALTLDELLALRRECAHDSQSVGLIEAFLDRTHGTDWRNAEAGATAEKPPPADDGKMTTERACAILGVPVDATPEQIRAAHHNLMKKLHPDQGGSDYLASEINAAKDFLLGRRR